MLCTTILLLLFSVMSKRQSSKALALATSSTPKARHYTRPGVEAAARLLALRPQLLSKQKQQEQQSDALDKWNCAYSQYHAMIQAKGGDKLVKLDAMREDIAKSWQQTTSTTACAFLTKEQLLNVIIEWKFLKGKPRNALKKMLHSNSDEDVRKHSTRAFELANDIPRDSTSEKNYNITESNVVSELCNLKGVGPATASAILGIYRPDLFAFMDDEVIECLYDGKRGYTLKIYMEVNTKCRALARELESAAETEGCESTSWSPYKVGQTLWTIATMSATKNEVLLSTIFNDGAGNEEGAMQHDVGSGLESGKEKKSRKSGNVPGNTLMTKRQRK